MKFELSVIDSHGNEQVHIVHARGPLAALEEIHVLYQRNKELKPHQYKVLTLHLIYQDADKQWVRSRYDIPSSTNPLRGDLTFSRT